MVAARPRRRVVGDHPGAEHTHDRSLNGTVQLRPVQMTDELLGQVADVYLAAAREPVLAVKRRFSVSPGLQPDGGSSKHAGGGLIPPADKKGGTTPRKGTRR